jgi:pyridoxamine 5'-phosphate oxidase
MQDSHPDQLDSILSMCWGLLARGVTDRRFGFHHPTLANVDEHGSPRSRVVILRSADQATKTLRFHTDIRSQKWQQLANNPAVTVLFYDEAEKTQLRIDGTASRHHADTVANAAWESSQRMSQITYGTNPGPGAPIATHSHFTMPETDDEILQGRANFAAVVIKVHCIEWLYLKVKNNRRAIFDLDANTAGWLVP